LKTQTGPRESQENPNVATGGRLGGIFGRRGVVATKAPVLDPVPFTATNGRYATEETIFLPLSDDGLNVNKIIVFFAFVDVLDPGSVVQLDL